MDLTSRIARRDEGIREALRGEVPITSPYAPLIEQLRIWAADLEAPVDVVTHAAIVERVIAGLREVAADLEREGLSA